MKDKAKSTTAIVGVGNMGGSLAQGLLDNDWPSDNILLVGKSSEQCNALRSTFPNCKIVTIEELTDEQIQTIILAVKPNSLQSTCTQLTSLSDETVFISAAAGVPITAIRQWLGKQRIIRCMPNTPAAIGLGMTGIYADQQVPEASKKIANDILSCTGATLWVANESMLDVVTAISGSGPAYLFYFMECLQKTAQEAGLNEQESYLLVSQMIYGAATLANQKEADFEQLRIAVTSKGGTTEKALQSLMEADFNHIIHQAVTAATKRATQISQSFTEE